MRNALEVENLEERTISIDGGTNCVLTVSAVAGLPLRIVDGIASTEADTGVREDSSISAVGERSCF